MGFHMKKQIYKVFFTDFEISNSPWRQHRDCAVYGLFVKVEMGESGRFKMIQGSIDIVCIL